MPWYYRLQLAINTAPFLVPTQQTNLALLVSTIRKQPEKPWYLATSLKDAKMAASWYWQRGWIEQSFKDSKSLFGLGRVRGGCPKRLSRLAMALTLALWWLTLMGLPGGGCVVSKGFRSALVAWGRASVIRMVLVLLEKHGNLPLCCLPLPTVAG